jgi:DNA-binding FadR family transcriptional regulator
MTVDSQPALSSLRRGPLVELVAAQLRAQLASGAWPVGSRLPAEAELGRQLQVGRSTLREAVRVLVHLGLLETRQGAGTFVRAAAPPSPWDARLRRAEILEVYEVRQALELRAAVLAAERRTPADLERLDRALADRNAARARARDSAYVEADLAFHQAVVAAAHNPILEELFTSFVAPLRDGLHKLVADEEMADLDSTDAHVELTSAIRAGDARAAERATSANLDGTAAALGRLLERSTAGGG